MMKIGAAMALLMVAGIAGASDRTFDACTIPKVSTSGWKTVELDNYLSVALPAGFERDTSSRFRHGGARWMHKDAGMVFEAYGASIGPYDPTRKHTAALSECPGTLNGSSVGFRTSIENGRYTASATFVEPKEEREKVGPHMILIISGHGKNLQEQRMLMQAIRTASKRK